MGGYQKLYRIGEVISIVAIISLVIFREMISFYDEVIYPYAFAILIMSVYFKKSVFTNKMICRMCIFVGKISYNIYLIHYAVCYLMKLYLPDYSYKAIAPIYIFIVIAYGIILNFILKKHKW